MSAALVIKNRAGERVEISLHPISLALLAAEVIEDAARGRCRKRGHVEDGSGHCERCGTSLPESDGRCHAWLPDAYRTIRGAR